MGSVLLASERNTQTKSVWHRRKRRGLILPLLFSWAAQLWGHCAPDKNPGTHSQDNSQYDGNVNGDGCVPVGLTLPWYVHLALRYPGVCYAIPAPRGTPWHPGSVVQATELGRPQA